MQASSAIASQPSVRAWLCPEFLPVETFIVAVDCERCLQISSHWTLILNIPSLSVMVHRWPAIGVSKMKSSLKPIGVHRGSSCTFPCACYILSHPTTITTTMEWTDEKRERQALRQQTVNARVQLSHCCAAVFIIEFPNQAVAGVGSTDAIHRCSGFSSECTGVLLALFTPLLLGY